MNEQRRVIGGDVSAKADPARASNRPAPLVEDTSVAGGTDRATGAPVIRPKGPDGKGDKLNETTDPRERP
jgi:hypothetical protein